MAEMFINQITIIQRQNVCDKNAYRPMPPCFSCPPPPCNEQMFNMPPNYYDNNCRNYNYDRLYGNYGSGCCDDSDLEQYLNGGSHGNYGSGCCDDSDLEQYLNGGSYGNYGSGCCDDSDLERSLYGGLYNNFDSGLYSDYGNNNDIAMRLRNLNNYSSNNQEPKTYIIYTDKAPTENNPISNTEPKTYIIYTGEAPTTESTIPPQENPPQEENINTQLQNLKERVAKIDSAGTKTGSNEKPIVIQDTPKPASTLPTGTPEKSDFKNYVELSTIINKNAPEPISCLTFNTPKKNEKPNNKPESLDLKMMSSHQTQKPIFTPIMQKSTSTLEINTPKKAEKPNIKPESLDLKMMSSH